MTPTPAAGAAPTGRGRLIHRERRPSGEPPPLPRDEHSARWWWALVGVVTLGVAFEAVVSSIDDLRFYGESLLRWFEDIRTPAATAVAKAFALLTSFGAVQILRIVVALALIVTKRFRHLVVALGTFVVIDWLVLTFLDVQAPPSGVTPLIDATDFRFPSWPMTAFAITVFTMPFVLAPAGQARKQAMTAAWILVALVGISRLYLGADYPSNVAYAALLSWVMCETLFRWFVPDEVFPISYRRGGNAAHLDLGGRRGDAVKQAMAEQVGLDVVEVEPFGLAGSGGSSPLRMTLADGSRVFGKIYATSHVRADRWYRIGRTILYGKLEDETHFTSVRRLAEYEDYALRYLAMNGVEVARTWGIVELTPNREYMLVTEFFEDSKNLGDSDIDETVIDEGLALVRQFWDIGVAHRDIKPANLLVQRGRLQLVDVSGLEMQADPVAPGGRPREHDADPGAADRHRPRLRASHGCLHAGRDRRGVRVRRRHGRADRAVRSAQAGPPADRRAVQGARPRRTIRCRSRRGGCGASASRPRRSSVDCSWSRWRSIRSSRGSTDVGHAGESTTRGFARGPSSSQTPSRCPPGPVTAYGPAIDDGASTRPCPAAVASSASSSTDGRWATARAIGCGGPGSSGGRASATSNEPIAVRRSATRWAPHPNAAPTSAASTRTYVPPAHTTVISTSSPRRSRTSNRSTLIGRSGASIDSPLRAAS